MNTAPTYRAVDQHTGITASTVTRDIDVMIAQRDQFAAAIATAVGCYDCPCGSEFELFDDASLEDYAALNRWLGAHVRDGHGLSDTPSSADEPTTAQLEKAIRQRDNFKAELDNVLPLACAFEKANKIALDVAKNYKLQAEQFEQSCEELNERNFELRDELAVMTEDRDALAHQLELALEVVEELRKEIGWAK